MIEQKITEEKPPRPLLYSFFDQEEPGEAMSALFLDDISSMAAAAFSPL